MAGVLADLLTWTGLAKPGLPSGRGIGVSESGDSPAACDDRWDGNPVHGGWQGGKGPPTGVAAAARRRHPDWPGGRPGGLRTAGRCCVMATGPAGRTLIASAIGSRWSGGRSDGYVKGYRLCIAVVLAGVALQGERDRVHTLTLGVLAGRGTATVYVQSRHAVVPVVRLVVEEEFGPQPGAHLIIVR